MVPKAIETGQTAWEAVLHGAREAIIVVDERARVLLCNERARIVLGLVEADLVHGSFGKVIPDLALNTMFAQARETGRPVRGEVPAVDGRTFNAQLTPITGVGCVVVMQDITRMKAAMASKSESVFALAHDLRAPLTSIQGYVSLLSRVGPINAQQEAFIRRVQDSVEAMTALIGQVVDASRIEVGLELEMALIDLREVIEETVLGSLPPAEEKDQQLRWDPPERLSLVRGDRIRLRRVMDHLIGNAVKFTGQGGRIVVKAGDEGSYVMVHVIDNGIGIPWGEQHQVFEKFYRAEVVRADGVGGAGLGLTFVRSVIEGLNGRVWVESRPGEGSRFSFVLPAAES